MDWSKKPGSSTAKKSQRGAMSRAAVSAASVTVMADEERKQEIELYCPRCHLAVTDPLACGDCSAIICRRCGAPLEQVDELGIG
jgi:hypothetical protein